MKKERRSSFTLAAEITALILVFVIIIVAAGADAIKREFDRGEYPRPYKKAVESAAIFGTGCYSGSGVLTAHLPQLFHLPEIVIPVPVKQPDFPFGQSKIHP